MRISVEAVMGELEAAGFSTRVLPQVLPRQFMVEGAVCRAPRTRSFGLGIGRLVVFRRTA